MAAINPPRTLLTNFPLHCRDMVQRWKIVNVDKMEALLNKEVELDDLCEYVGGMLFDMLTEVKWVPVTKIMTSLSIDYKRYRGPQPLGRLQLPAEIIGMIFSEIDNLSDVFSLAVANTRLMILGENRLRELMPVPSWRGDRLICIGSGTENEDLPEEILSEEYDDFLDNPPALIDLKRPLADLYMPLEFIDWVRVRFTPANVNSQYHQRDSLSRNMPGRRWTPGKYSDFMDGLTLSRRPASNADVLWNLSKKVYVRSEVVLAGRDYVGIDVTEIMGDLLHVHICWATNDGTGRERHQGRWAGDRFEFTSRSVMETRLLKEGDDWTDDSEEAVERFKEAFDWDSEDVKCVNCTLEHCDCDWLGV